MHDRRRVKNIVGGSAGNLVEWFDWCVYSAFALYFAPVFFPEGNQTAQLMQTAAIFAVGFVMRPIGAWAMGIYADHKGRKAGLSLSVSLMCLGSLAIAAAPTYAQAGLLSPAILVVARMVQGLSLGGEYGSSAVYLSEVAGRERRGFFSSFQYVTLISGQLIAGAVLLLLQFLLTEADLEAWGWRIPFGIGAIPALATLTREGLAAVLHDCVLGTLRQAVELVLVHRKPEARRVEPAFHVGRVRHDLGDVEALQRFHREEDAVVDALRQDLV